MGGESRVATWFLPMEIKPHKKTSIWFLKYACVFQFERSPNACVMEPDHIPSSSFAIIETDRLWNGLPRLLLLHLIFRHLSRHINNRPNNFISIFQTKQTLFQNQNKFLECNTPTYILSFSFNPSKLNSFNSPPKILHKQYWHVRILLKPSRQCF